jgi:hypothetical protein
LTEPPSVAPGPGLDDLAISALVRIVAVQVEAGNCLDILAGDELLEPEQWLATYRQLRDR